MNNFKVLMNGIVKENPHVCTPFGYVSYIRNNIFCHQWYGDGIGYGFCINLF